MGYTNSIGKYQLIRTIGEGMFAKVKLAVNRDNGQYVAIKIIDKQMVVKRNLMYQVNSKKTNFRNPYLCFFNLCYIGYVQVDLQTWFESVFSERKKQTFTSSLH